MKTEALLHALPARKKKLRLTSFFFFTVIVGDVDTKAFINTMQQNQAEVKIRTHGDTLRNVDAKHRQTRWLTVEKVFETLTDLKGAPLFKTLFEVLEEVKAKTVGKTLGDVKVEALLHFLADTLEKAVP